MAANGLTQCAEVHVTTRKWSALKVRAMLASTSKTEAWKSFVTCPEGHKTAKIFFDRPTLARRVREGGPIPLFCRVCSRHRDATAQERARLERAMRGIFKKEALSRRGLGETSLRTAES